MRRGVPSKSVRWFNKIRKTRLPTTKVNFNANLEELAHLVYGDQTSGLQRVMEPPERSYIWAGKVFLGLYEQKAVVQYVTIILFLVVVDPYCIHW